MLSNFFIRVNANNEVASHGLGLSQRVGVTEVHHVVAPAAPNADEEGMEEDEVEDQPEQTILELDVDGYVSGEDPDFKPEKEMLDAASESDDTDDEDLNKSGVERME